MVLHFTILFLARRYSVWIYVRWYCSYCLCCFLQSKQGAVIRRNDENSHHTRSQGELVHLLMDISRYDDVSCNRPEEILHRISV